MAATGPQMVASADTRGSLGSKDCLQAPTGTPLDYEAAVGSKQLSSNCCYYCLPVPAALPPSYFVFLGSNSSR